MTSLARPRFMILIKKSKLNFLIGSFDQNLAFIKGRLEEKKSIIFLPSSLNDLKQSDDFRFKSVYENVDYSTLDGMPFVFYFRFLKILKKIKVNKIERAYGPDLMSSILETDKKHKHFLCGTTKNNLENLKKNLELKNKNLKIVGSFAPPFEELGNFQNQVLEKLKQSKANVLWIGLSSPKQVELASFIKVSGLNIKIFCVGAAFDFLSRSKPQAPVFLQKTGFEWLFRMFNETRLIKRYLFDIPFFLLKKLFLIFNFKKNI